MDRRGITATRQACRSRESNSGLTLVELLVAIAIGVVLSFGAMNLLLHSKKSYLESEELARLQENGRHALRYLSYELTMAGHLATQLPRTAIDSSLSGSPCFDYLMLTATPLEQVDNVLANGMPDGGGWSLPVDCLLAGRHKPGSDVLVIRRTASSPVVSAGQRLASINPDGLYLEQAGTYSTLGLGRGDTVATTGQLWEYLPQVLFLRNYSIVSGDGIPALCRKRPGRSSNRMAPTECLVEGIEQLQLEFGIDETGDQLADRFEVAPGLAELRTAVAVRIYLLVRSLHSVAGYVDTRSYTLGSARLEAPNDGYYRRLMQTTVLLRNNGGFRP
jgi:type IV pilus assembly protein PilW